MKAIIHGRRYDTEAATKIATTSSRAGRGDYSWWEESLYQTPRSKSYFLAGMGHARSHYAANLGGGAWGPGEKITPLTDDEAFAWAQDRLTADEVEALFPDRIEDA